MDTKSAVQLFLLLILIILSGFFSSAETAFTTVNRVKLRTMAEDGNKRAKRVEDILDKYSKMLSTILVGNNIVNISASSLATSMTIRLWGSRFVGIVTGILTFVILVLGEIVPKNWANKSSEKLALIYSGTVKTLMNILTPVVFIIDRIARGILYLMHIDPDVQDDQITEDELKTYVDVSHEGGEIENEEHEMIYNVLDFSDSEAEEIMIPREEMTAVSVEVSYDELKSIFKDKMFTRIPVWENDDDNFIGLINIKDFIFIDDKNNFDIRKLLREPFFTVEHKKTSDLMMEMRENRHAMAFVLNEYGSCVGMITMEDLLEEIVGEIRDEFDEDEEMLIQELGDRKYLIEASMKTDDINDALGTELHSEDYDSIGGLMIEKLERLPEDGETVTLDDGSTLQAMGLNQNRILKVELTLAEKNTENGSSEDETETTFEEENAMQKD